MVDSRPTNPSIYWRLWRWVGYCLARWMPQAAVALNVGVAERIVEDLKCEVFELELRDLEPGSLEPDSLEPDEHEMLTPTETVTRVELKSSKKNSLN